MRIVHQALKVGGMRLCNYFRLYAFGRTMRNKFSAAEFCFLNNAPVIDLGMRLLTEIVPINSQSKPIDTQRAGFETNRYENKNFN